MGRSLKAEVKVTIQGKILNPNREKRHKLNVVLEKYRKAVKFFASFKIRDKTLLQEKAYKEARMRFGLSSTLTQTARDKAVELVKENEGREFHVHRVSIRVNYRAFKLVKRDTKLTPYWLYLQLDGEGAWYPVQFGKRQEEMIEDALVEDEWSLQQVELVKRGGEWYAYFTLEKPFKGYKPQTAIGIDLGKRNLATVVALVNDKPVKGTFFRSSKIKEVRHKYFNIRKKLQEKRRLDVVRRLRGKERRIVNHELHVISKKIVEYAKQFPSPVIVMERLTGIRENFERGKKLNRRFHSLPFRKLQSMIEYKAKLEDINVIYINPKNTSRTCHRCGHVTRADRREYRCPKCGMIYNRDLNASINIARALTRGTGRVSVNGPKGR
ncbi:IS200/IS605 family element transposase accessory protein TnpB [Metallosphaera hakonensis JCM 8857 = DSM 7519]|uniref:Transposase n=1 Tax=Metallosphaera hakonensis JCM 8857 = DSM 7519 TaxID=1293036 RepID=A0A2U9IR75_9CREN|nr:IS200/IS605 family element transposase accessory protein TnpB [Metallosphaera hakonensis JCM 8857 = DSM 7519]